MKKYKWEWLNASGRASPAKEAEIARKLTENNATDIIILTHSDNYISVLARSEVPPPPKSKKGSK